MNVKETFGNALNVLRSFTTKHQHELFAGAGVVCFVIGGITAVAVTPKATKLLEEKKEELKTEELQEV